MQQACNTLYKCHFIEKRMKKNLSDLDTQEVENEAIIGVSL